MSKKPKIFYSFHYELDVIRTQQVRNIGSVEGNKPVSPIEWEQVKRSGDNAVKNWIDKNLANADCFIVLIGQQTSARPWVRYEIEKAWSLKKPMQGIYIHNLRDFQLRVTNKGVNPFSTISLNMGYGNQKKISDYLPSPLDPNPYNAYQDIVNKLDKLISDAIHRRRILNASLRF
ncbi:MAG: TIR domain-containing protein [Cyanobacteria bacterium REEB446]|nr:TIR domain-containing protein [Cyanobacteria bacterium REEB446]